MIDKKMITALRIIEQKLIGHDISWVLVGSTSLALQSVDITPQDIDILTDKDGAYGINKLLKDYEVKPVKYRQSDRFQSYLGEFTVNNIKLEVMGDYREKIKGKWQDLDSRLASPATIQFEGMQLPVSPLRAQLRSYELSGREKDSAKIQAIRMALNSHRNTGGPN